MLTPYSPSLTKYETIHQAYRGLLIRVLYEYEHASSPRGLRILEKMNTGFFVTNPVSEPTVTRDPERNVVIQRYFKAECELYDSMTNSAEDFTKASRFWKTIANPDGTINSAYGYLIWQCPSLGNVKFNPNMLTPWEWAMSSLKKDIDTRQAILPFVRPDHFWAGNKDVVCTLHAAFHIRDMRLSMTTIMRSNDLVKGLVYDLPWFVHLMDRAVEELSPVYPGLKKGTYTHMGHSVHIYEKDIEVVKRMIGTHATFSEEA